MGMTASQQAAYDAALALTQEAEAVPTQKLRTLAQGLTFGGADEAEAWLVSQMSDKPYEDALNEVRGKLKAYQGARPWEALGYEAGGAALPAIAAALLTVGSGGAAAPATAPAAARILPMLAKFGKLAGIGALEGGLYAFGTGEGGLEKRLEDVPFGARTGAAGSLAGAAVAAVGKKVLGKITDFARRKFGGRGAKIVENEIQRIAAQTGKTVDEITDDVVSGRIMAENKTLAAIVRAYNSEGGEAATRLKSVLPERATKLRGQALSEMQEYLTGADDNILRAVRQTDDAARAAETAAYAKFKGVAASDDLIEAAKDALRRVPEAGDELKKAYRASTGEAPFFDFGPDGAVIFQRNPTVDEIERIRRAVSNMAAKSFREGSGLAGDDIKAVERTLRTALGEVEGLSETRATASVVRSARDAFQDGRKALSRSPEQISVDFEDIVAQGPEAVSAYRAGVMSAYKAKAATGQQKSMMRLLSDPDRKEGAILRTIFPEDELDRVLDIIDRASAAQEVSGYALQGSATAQDLAQQRKIGSAISLEDISNITSGSPIAIASTASKAIKAMTSGLSDAQRLQVVNILLSENPNVVRNALIDESGVAVLAEAVNKLASVGGAGVRRAAATEAQNISGLLSQGQ